MKQNNTILLAAGGTGGHVFPAIATGSELAKQGYQVIFVTDKRGEKYLAGKGLEFVVISSASPNSLGNILKLLKGIIQAIPLMRKHKPLAVIGYGGYPSFPPLLVAKLFCIKTILHEQNSVLGKANRLLAKFANIVATSFPQTFNAKNPTLVGNPVRSEIKPTPYPEISGKINILVTGGSQGAKIFSSVVTEVVCKFADKVRITQQVVASELEAVSEKYREAWVEFEAKSFFNDMPDQLAKAHLVIARSGASTIFELAMAGRPAIFVPLAIAAEDHQRINAESVVRVGGGWIIKEKDFNAESLSELIEKLIANPEMLKTAAHNIKSFAKPRAAQDLAGLVTK